MVVWVVSLRAMQRVQVNLEPACAEEALVYFQLALLLCTGLGMPNRNRFFFLFFLLLFGGIIVYSVIDEHIGI